MLQKYPDFWMVFHYRQGFDQRHEPCMCIMLMWFSIYAYLGKLIIWKWVININIKCQICYFPEKWEILLVSQNTLMQNVEKKVHL